MTAPVDRRRLTTLDLGGMRGTFAWRPETDRSRGIPAGIAVTHGGHMMVVLWAELEHPAGVGLPRVELVTLKPLTIADTLQCSSCPLIGRIIEDRWVPDA